MSYYADLSEYVYSKENLQPNTLNIGWLDNEHTYFMGEVSEDFVDQLFQICSSPMSKSRGWHPCPFCKEYPVKVQRNGNILALGAAEIKVTGKCFTYISPDLIYHYVVAHKYCPPKEFVNAVLK
jgi:hypothetical protein